MLYDRSKSVNIFTVKMRQRELAEELGITRQALNVHLRKLRDKGFIRTGRGFIDITERGIEALGLSSKLTFLFVKVSPVKRTTVYERVCELPVRSVFRVTGDMDLIVAVDRDKLDSILSEVSQLDGVEDTRSYITLEVLK
jgi:DNA-binding Lrp family transcriptional regulator